MKKLTSNSTFFNKRVFPVIWFGILALAVVLPQLSGGKNAPEPIFFIFPVLMAVFGYFIMKKLVFDLIDEVYDEGDTLLFKNGGKEVRVHLRDIKNVSYQTMINPARVTINLRYETELGKDLSFLLL